MSKIVKKAKGVVKKVSSKVAKKSAVAKPVVKKATKVVKKASKKPAVKKVIKKAVKVTTVHKSNKAGVVCGAPVANLKKSPQWAKVTCKNCLRSRK